LLSDEREELTLGIDEPVEFEKHPGRVQEIREITNRFRRIYGAYFQLNKRLSERCQYVTNWTWNTMISTDCVQKSSRTLLLRGRLNTRLRAHDHYTASTLIGGKGGAGPSSFHATLEGPTEYVNARWM
jgi:hypothetical protein